MPKPAFLTRGVRCSGLVRRGAAEQHLPFTVEAGNGMRFKGKMWNAPELADVLDDSPSLEILFHLTWPYGDGTKPEIEIVELA